jgi:glycosyltransferase involved in cell wall biosynthesis
MLLNQLKFLKSQGYDIYAICSGGERLKDVEKEGIKVKKILFKRKVFTPIADITAFLKLYFYFKKEKFSIVHVHTLKPEFYGQIAAQLAGVPVILNTLHGFDFAESDPLTKKMLFLSLERVAAKCSTAIFSIGKHIIKRAGQEKIGRPEKFIYLGRDIDTERFNPDNFSLNFLDSKKKELNIPLGKKVIGIVARLVAEKGYLELFKAFSNIIKKYPDAILLIIGQNEPEKKDAINLDVLEEYGIRNNVIFLGERNDVEQIYPLMDVFVLPTHREGLGAAILEAEAMKVPVVASDIGGCPETIDNGKTGILVPVSSIEKLTEALLFILDNPQKAIDMGQSGRDKVLREFSKEIVFSRLKKEYENLIKNYVSPKN